MANGAKTDGKTKTDGRAAADKPAPKAETSAAVPVAVPLPVPTLSPAAQAAVMPVFHGLASGGNAATPQAEISSVRDGASAGQSLQAAQHDKSSSGAGAGAAVPEQKTAFAQSLPAAGIAAAPSAARPEFAATLAAQPVAASATSATASPVSSPLPQAVMPGAVSSPVHQAAAAMVAMGAGPDPGTQRLTITMTPFELGHVTIHIDRLADGSAAVAVSATHAATLAALHGDRPALEQALTQAGVPVQHRTIEFRIETPSSSGAGSAAQNGSAGSDTSGQQGRQAGRGTLLASQIPVATADPESARPVMRRYGVNLTA